MAERIDSSNIHEKDLVGVRYFWELKQDTYASTTAPTVWQNSSETREEEELRANSFRISVKHVVLFKSLSFDDLCCELVFPFVYQVVFSDSITSKLLKDDEYSFVTWLFDLISYGIHFRWRCIINYLTCNNFVSLQEIRHPEIDLFPAEIAPMGQWTVWSKFTKWT